MYKSMLKQYVRNKLPIVDGAIGLFDMEKVRQVFVAATGVPVASADSVEEGSERFLEALQDAEHKGLLTLVVLPKAMKSIINIKKQRSRNDVLPRVTIDSSKQG